MITPKDIENKTMTEDKRANARNDYFAFYIGRPLSYVLTIPFLYTNITPNIMSIISIIPAIVGFVLMGMGRSKAILILGWVCFFLWNLLDGVDGNIARYKNEFSRMGSVYDAMSGYIAMVLTFFAVGWAAAHDSGLLMDLLTIPSEIYIVLGALSGIFQIFPRLIMHKAITTLNDESGVSDVKDKSNYGLARTLALNLTSVSGFVQVFMLIAVLFNMLGLFTVGYFILNMIVMIVSLISIFKGK